MKFVLSMVLSFSLTSCSSQEEMLNNDSSTIYYPTVSNWETVSPTVLGWNTNALSDLDHFLNETGTKGFIIVKDGRIAYEWYGNGHNQSSNWYWASAGKTLTAAAIGIAQNEGLLSITETTSNHLDTGWTSLTPIQENEISIRNQLSMTSGLFVSYQSDFNCQDPSCLTYDAAPGTQWNYHNGSYTLLQTVITNASNQSFSNFFDSKIASQIGMNGHWTQLQNNSIYISDTRSMARFGWLILNKGKWEFNQVIPENYVQEMTNTSQDLNKSYGYLWWLNGKSSYKLPFGQSTNSGSLIPNAPHDLVAGLGKNDQKLYVIPSQNMVIIRMGQGFEMNVLVPISYDIELWEKLNSVFSN